MPSALRLQRRFLRQISNSSGGTSLRNSIFRRMNHSTAINRSAEIVAAILLVTSFALIQSLIGGMRLLFSLPAYGLLALVAFLSVFSLRRVKPLPDWLCLLSAAVFFSYVLIRAWLSPVPYLARADIYSILGGLIVYLFVACVLVNTRARMAVLLFLLIIALAQVVVGAIQFREANNFMPISFLQRFDYGRRASGFYICPNHLAGLLEVLGLFGLSLVCWSRWPAWGKILVGYMAIVCYAGLVLTGSRGGYLSAAGGLIIFVALSLLVLRRTGWELFRRVAIAGSLAAVIIAASCFFLIQKSDYLSGRAGNVFDRTNMRLDLWQAALKQWQLQPVVGTGAGTYLFFGRQFRTDRVQVDPVEVHNDYLHLLAEYGILGVVGFALFLAAHARRGWRSFQRLGPGRVAISGRPLSNALALNVGALCSVAAYAIHSGVDFNLHVPANVLLLAFVFGLLANPGIERNGALERVSFPTVSWRLALPALGLIVAVQCVRLLPGEYFTERSRTALRDFRPAESILFAVRGLSYERQNPDLYNYLGRARLMQGHRMTDPAARQSFYQAALNAFWKGRALVPRDENFALELGSTYDALDRYPEGEWMFVEARSLDPRSKSVKQSYQAHLERWRKAYSQPTAKQGMSP
jgi:O-antigen ligase